MSLTRKWMPSPHYSSRYGGAVRLIVVHSTEGATTIESLGNWFANPSAQVSSHTGIDNADNNTIGEYVKPGQCAWTAGNANGVAIQTELCCPSGASANWSTADWKNKPHMLRKCAAWIAEEAKRYGLPITELTPSQAQGSGRGVCQHSDLGSWGGGHYDCGNGFPMQYVLDMAKGGSATPAKEREIEDMVYLEFDSGGSATIVVPNEYADGDHRVRFGCTRNCAIEVDFKEGKTRLNLSWDNEAQGLKIPKDRKFGAVRILEPPGNAAKIAMTYS